MERARESTATTREALAANLADQEQQEVLLADGGRRLIEEKATPSPFNGEPPHVVWPQVVTSWFGHKGHPYHQEMEPTA